MNIVVADTPLPGCEFIVPPGVRRLLVSPTLNMANTSAVRAIVTMKVLVNGVAVVQAQKDVTIPITSNDIIVGDSVVNVRAGDRVNIAVRVPTEQLQRVVFKVGTGVLYSSL